MGHVHYILEDLGTMSTEVLSQFCDMQYDTCTKDDPNLVGFYTESVSI